MTTPADVIEQLARGPALIAGVLASVPPADLKRRPAAGKWSAHEHACHVALIEPNWAARLELMLREDNPAIVNYEPDDEDPDTLLNMDLPAALASYTQLRERLVERLRALPAPSWSRPAEHPMHARYSVYLMLRHAALHDALHGYRIEESALGTHWPGERSR